MKKIRLYITLLAYFMPFTLMAYQGEFTTSLSRNGQTGLIELPNARMHDEGLVSMGGNYAYPNFISYLMIQPFSWLQSSIHYTNTQDLWKIKKHDNNRNLDAKIRFFKESAFIPETSLGFIDGLGTPQLRGFYGAFSKRYYDLDFTLGFIWGHYGLHNLYRNPHKFIGTYNPPTLFQKNLKRHTHLIPFAGIEYATPIKGLNLKLEAIGDHHISKKLGRYAHKLPVNIGLCYQPFSWLQLSTGFENGHQWMAGLSLMTNVNKNLPTLTRPTPPPMIKARSETPNNNHLIPKEEINAQRIIAFLSQKGFKIESLYLGNSKITVVFENTLYRLQTQALGRLARALTQIAPNRIHFFELIQSDKNLHLQKIIVKREALEKVAQGHSSIEEIWPHLFPSDVPSELPTNLIKNRNLYPIFSPYILPKIRQSLFDQNKPIRLDIGAGIGTQIEFGYGFLGAAEIGITLLNDLDNLKIESPHQGHRVRSDIKNYVKHGRQNLTHLQFDKLFQLNSSLFARTSIGYFEQMFGGISQEFLYRPYDRNFAFGIEMNHVWQRTFNQRFEFQKYNVTNGHASFYTDLPFWDIETHLHLGRYLAKDWGGTLEIAKRFKTGVEIGVFGTLTNINRKKYDETRFDKGLWIKIPLEWILGGSTRQEFDYNLRPLSKDGGQRVYVSNRLYKLTSPYSKNRLEKNSHSFLK
ncbi:MAG: YjbH domain-containing protein [Alphaproteobacteria bacterium]|nr:YjbH domain-containing protein [Alphaproteobacteria bacterium]